MSTRTRGRHSARALACVGVLSLSGCTALNTAFDNGEVDSFDTGGDVSTAAAATSDATTNDSKSSGSDSDGSTVASSLSAAGTDTLTQTSSGVDPSSTCDPYAGPLVHGILADQVAAACLGVVSVPQARIAMRGKVLSVTTCEACPTNCNGPGYAIDLDATVAVPGGQTPQCGRVVMWSSPPQTDPCDWLGVSILAADGAPRLVVSDRLMVPPAAGGMAATMLDRIPCDGSCSAGEQPGRYSLAMGGEHVPSGQTGAAVVSVNGNPTSAVFENRSAVVEVDCEAQVSWVLDFT